MNRTIRGLAVVLLAAAAGNAAEEPKDAPKADPAGTPLELRLTGTTVKYTLDTGGLSIEEFQKKLNDAAKKGNRPPAAPTVDLAVEVKNTSDKPVRVWSKGDPVVLTLTLKGKGAVNIEPKLAFTLEFRVPEVVEIAPGKVHTIPVKSLTSGFRGLSKYSYWTAPGEYELVAALKTGMQPIPKGAKENDGFGVVTVTSPTLKLTVDEKK